MSRENGFMKKYADRYSPLNYKDIHEADSIRSQVLTPTSPFPVHTHFRRRGKVSDLFNCGVAIDNIKTIGHWKMGVLDVYLIFTPEYLAAIQLAGILKAEQRLDSGATSKIMVRLNTIVPCEQEIHLLQRFLISTISYSFLFPLFEVGG